MNATYTVATPSAKWTLCPSCCWFLTAIFIIFLLYKTTRRHWMNRNTMLLFNDATQFYDRIVRQDPAIKLARFGKNKLSDLKRNTTVRTNRLRHNRILPRLTLNFDNKKINLLHLPAKQILICHI